MQESQVSVLKYIFETLLYFRLVNVFFVVLYELTSLLHLGTHSFG